MHPQPESRPRLGLIIATLLGAAFLSALDSNIVATALPTIAGEMKGFSRLAWVTTAYIVTSTISSIILAKLSDLYGRRPILLITIGLFVAGSLLCGAAQSVEQLIAFRAIQGLGGGGILSIVFAVLGDLVPPIERSKYSGYFSIVFASGGVIGPLLGGLIVDHGSWRWIFFINLPLGAIVMLVISRALRLPKPTREVHIDYLGAAVLAALLAAFMIGLEQTTTRGWRDGFVLTLFALAVIGLAAFVTVEQRAREPIIPLHLFRSRLVVCVSVLAMLLGAILFALGIYFALFFQDVRFVSPTTSGLRLLPQVLAMTLVAIIAGRMMARTGRYRWYPIVGAATIVIGMSVASGISVSTSYLRLGVALTVVGLGLGNFVLISSIAQNAAGPRDMGVVSALQTFFRNLGGAVGLAVYSTVFTAEVKRGLVHRLPAGQSPTLKIIRDPKSLRGAAAPIRDAVQRSITDGVSTVFHIAIGIALVALVISIVMPEIPMRRTLEVPGSE